MDIFFFKLNHSKDHLQGRGRKGRGKEMEENDWFGTKHSLLIWLSANICKILVKISGRRNCFAFSLLTETEGEDKNKTLNHLSLSAGSRELVLSKTGERCLLSASTDCLLPEMLWAPLIKCTIFKNCTIFPSPAFWFIDVKISALGKPRYKKNGKKRWHCPLSANPPPKRVKRGHLLSEKRP